MDKRESPIGRADRRLGVLWARMCVTIAAIAGVAAAWSVPSLEDFSFAVYWPALGFSVLMLLIAHACFRSRTGLMDQLSEAIRSSTPKQRR